MVATECNTHSKPKMQSAIDHYRPLLDAAYCGNRDLWRIDHRGKVINLFDSAQIADSESSAPALRSMLAGPRALA